MTDSNPAPNPSNPNPAPAPTQSINKSEFDVLANQVQQLTNGMGQIMQHLQRAPEPAPPAPPPITYNPEDWQNPERAPSIVADIVARETAKALQPVNEMRLQFQRRDMYQAVKAQVKASNPMLAQHWDKIEPMLDQTFGTGSIDVNPQVVTFQAHTALGYIFTQNPAALLTTPSAPSAPSMIPSSGAEPPKPPTKPLEPLSEFEEADRKRRGISHEDYLKIKHGDGTFSPSWMKSQTPPAGGK